MIPDQLPASVESGAERRCYDALRAELSDAFTVLYDVAWVGRGRYEGQQGHATSWCCTRRTAPSSSK